MPHEPGTKELADLFSFRKPSKRYRSPTAKCDDCGKRRVLDYHDFGDGVEAELCSACRRVRRQEELVPR